MGSALPQRRRGSVHGPPARGRPAGCGPTSRLRDERWGRLHVLAVDGTLRRDRRTRTRPRGRGRRACAPQRRGARPSHRPRSQQSHRRHPRRQLRRRGRLLPTRRRLSGRPAGKSLFALVLEPQGLASFMEAEDRSESDRRRMRRRFVDETQRAAAAVGAVALAGLDGDAVLAIVGVDPGCELREAADQLGAAVCTPSSGHRRGRRPCRGRQQRGLTQVAAPRARAGRRGGRVRPRQNDRRESCTSLTSGCSTCCCA